MRDRTKHGPSFLQAVSACDAVSFAIDDENDSYDLHARYLNGMLVRVLRTIGYDLDFRTGIGPYLFDSKGRRYLDLLSGWGVFGIGRNHPKIRSALTSVLARDLPNLLQMGVSALAGVLAERLVGHVPFLEKVFFANTGSEAVEASIKFARKATGRPGLVYCAHAFHGMTYGALSLNGETIFRHGFSPLVPECVCVPYNDLHALDEALRSRTIAAFIVEPIQGKTVHVADEGYLKEAERLCRKYGTLLVADEIQTGLGRTGRFLAIDHWGVEPDMVLLSKTLSGGHVPVSAVLVRKWIFDKVFDRMDHAVIHGSTFGMNDLAMAAGIATLDVIETEGIVQNAARQGARLLRNLNALVPHFEMMREVRGRGLMIGIEFGPPRSLKLKPAWHSIEAMNPGLFCQLISIPLLRDHQILAQVAAHGSHTVKLLPALVISDSDCDWIERALTDVIERSHHFPSSAWSLGKTLVTNAFRARADHARSS